MVYHAIKLSLIIAFLSIETLTMAQETMAQDKRAAVAEKLWAAIGGKENWQNARYFMFSCVGGNGGQAFVRGERRYLWDKKTGDCRFEAITTDDEMLLALFNIKTAKGAVYLNGVQLDNPKTRADVIDEAIAEFEKDAYLLFLPTVLEGSQVNYSITGEKLVDSQRFSVINIKNQRTSFETSVEGRLYMNTETGQVQRWHGAQTSTEFAISGFKDIGSGLVLPTRFIASDSATSVTYPIAAALVNIEEHKFNKP